MGLSKEKMFQYTIKNVEELGSGRYSVSSVDGTPTCSDQTLPLSKDKMDILLNRFGFLKDTPYPYQQLVGITIQSNLDSFGEALERYVENLIVAPKDINLLNDILAEAITAGTIPKFARTFDHIDFYFQSMFDNLLITYEPHGILDFKDNGWLTMIQSKVPGVIKHNDNPSIMAKTRQVMYFTYTTPSGTTMEYALTPVVSLIVRSG